MKEVLERLSRGELPGPGELEGLLSGTDEELFLAADRVRRQWVGDTVHIRGILEFSNYCRCHCAYCGLRAENRELHRYRMSEEEIVEAAGEAWEAGYRTLVLQSGEDSYYTCERMCSILRRIKEKYPIILTVSIGERPYEELRRMREAGADRYLLKHETADAGLYAALHPHAQLQSRVECLQNIHSLGYETGSGFMVGLPGQELGTLARDLLLLRELKCDMAGIGPFIPHPSTPLGREQAGSVALTERCVALARLLLPRANLPATTALGVLSPDGRDRVFSGGANVIMRKVTPWRYRRDYEIYPTDFGPQIDVQSARKALEEYIRSIGKIPL